MPLISKLTICVASPHGLTKSSGSPSFIEDQCERLSGPLKRLTGGFHPEISGDGRFIQPLWARFLFRTLHELKIPGYSDTYACRIAGWLKRNQVDVVLAQYGPMGLSLLEGCRLARIPLVVHFHGYDAYRDDVLHWAADRYPELFEYASACIAVSEPMKAQLIKLGACPVRVFVNPCGVDTHRFQARSEVPESHTFLGVFRFTEKKGPFLLVKAFHKVREHLPGARLELVGDGHLLEPTIQLAHTLNLDGSVEFHGWKSHEEICAFLLKATAFVQHSVVGPDNDREGTPVSIMEASAAGLPIVSTRHEGINEVVKDGITGLLVDEYDVDGMASAMVKIAKNPAWALQLGAAARVHVQKKYEMVDRVRNLEKILYNACGAKYE